MISGVENDSLDPSKGLWRSQFILGRNLADLECLGLTSSRIGDWTLWSSPEFMVTRAGAVTVLGLAAAVSGESLADHYSSITAESHHEDVVELTLDVAGRFVVFATLTSGAMLIPDGVGGKATFLSADGAIASSSEMLLKKSGATARARTAIERRLETNPALVTREYATYGLHSPISGFGRLLPNRVANLDTGESLLCSPATVKRETSVPDAARNLRKNVSALATLGPFELGLTAGFDSRLVLAALDAEGIDVETYTFTDGGAEKANDAQVAGQVAQALGYRHEAVPEPETDPNVLEALRLTQPMVRKLPKVFSHLTWLSQRPEKRITISGAAAEIYRSHFGLVPPGIGREATRRTVLRLDPDPHDLQGFDQWWDDRFRPGSADSHIPATTLFYWEQQMAIWGTLFLSEKDLFVDELSAFGSGRLQQQLTSFPQFQRTTLRSQLNIDLIEELSPRMAQLERPHGAPSLRQRVNYATPIIRVARNLRPGWGS